jgi:hypothetical protein
MKCLQIWHFSAIGHLTLVVASAGNTGSAGSLGREPTGPALVLASRCRLQMLCQAVARARVVPLAA